VGDLCELRAGAFLSVLADRWTLSVLGQLQWR
jgi:hypothetical protein